MRMTRAELTAFYNKEVETIRYFSSHYPESYSDRLANARDWYNEQLALSEPDVPGKLGDKLKATIALMDELKIAESARDTAEKLAKEIARKNAIQAKLEEYKALIISNIESGLVFKKTEMPSSWTAYGNGVGGSYSISHAKHPDHSMWLEFCGWARSEGLSVSCDYQHDGFGVQSWYVLNVRPL